MENAKGYYVELALSNESRFLKYISITNLLFLTFFSVLVLRGCDPYWNSTVFTGLCHAGFFLMVLFLPMATTFLGGIKKLLGSVCGF